MYHAELFAEILETTENSVENARDNWLRHPTRVLQHHVQASTVHVLHAYIDVPVSQKRPIEANDVRRGAIVQNLHRRKKEM